MYNPVFKVACRMTKIGVPRETREGETRVALVPDMAKELQKLDFAVYVEANAGLKSNFPDNQYMDASASIAQDATSLYKECDVILRIQPPSAEEMKLARDGTTMFGLFWVLSNKGLVEQFKSKKMTVFSMELVPRITRAQSMDVLSSMSTIAGYKAVLLATERFGKFMPMLMTAAGTITPAGVLVIGAGVAGLTAIGTARRLGARVEAFDTRPAVKEQIESLGAKFVAMELPKDSETKGGYAKEMSEEFVKKEMDAISSRLPKTDIVISTAQVFGRKAPVLITEEMVKLMPAGSVIVDIAAEQGGNCALTKAGATVEKHGVTIIGPLNLPASMPLHASQMYSRNTVNLLKHIYGGKDRKPDFSDEITKGCCACNHGELVSEAVVKAYGGGSSK
jgi:NAD(P) transhydrogenase subunit alpha